MREDFFPFALEREMSIWENRVRYNLSESGVKPLTLVELFEGEEQALEALMHAELNYPQTNGLPKLQEAIAAMYPGAGPENVVVTVGAAQANFTVLMSELDPGEEIAVMLPNYMQIYGVAKNYGLDVRTFSLREEDDWALDTSSLKQAITGKTKLVAVCNPNNPSGHILTAEERQAVIEAAADAGAWILSDEVYAGAERDERPVTPSLWGEYERVFAIGSLSKAYGLPGLRIGWVVAPPDAAERIWARQDYITISATMLANRIATYALQPAVRSKILSRTRKYIRRGLEHFSRWVQENSELLSFVSPQAAAIAFVKYERPINSRELVQRLIREHEAYVVPGDHFGLDQHLRISFGLPVDYLQEGLKRVLAALKEA